MVNITENAKLDLLGYYCLDLEMASVTLGPEVEAKDGNTPPTLSIRAKRSSTSFNETSNQPFRSQKFFSFFLAFFLQEDFSMDEMIRIRAIWKKDRESEIEVVKTNMVNKLNKLDASTKCWTSSTRRTTNGH